MNKERYYIKLDEQSVLRLPYYGPPSRRIYVLSMQNKSTVTRELFVQRSEAFTTSLVGIINNLKNFEISEIRYSFGIDCVVRILLNEKGKLMGECSCESKKSLDDLKQKLKIKE
jgi:hypothetical protein